MGEEPEKNRFVLVIGFIIGVIAVAATFEEGIMRLFGLESGKPSQHVVESPKLQGPAYDVKELVERYAPEGTDASPITFAEFHQTVSGGKYDTYVVEELLRRLKGRRVYWSAKYQYPINSKLIEPMYYGGKALIRFSSLYLLSEEQISVPYLLQLKMTNASFAEANDGDVINFSGVFQSFSYEKANAIRNQIFLSDAEIVKVISRH